MLYDFCFESSLRDGREVAEFAPDSLGLAREDCIFVGQLVSGSVSTIADHRVVSRTASEFIRFSARKTIHYSSIVKSSANRSKRLTGFAILRDLGVPIMQ